MTIFHDIQSWPQAFAFVVAIIVVGLVFIVAIKNL